MLKIKIYDCEDEKELEQKINNLIIDLDSENKEILDIKYQANCSIQNDEQVYIYSALIMYDDKKYTTPKRYEIVEKVKE